MKRINVFLVLLIIVTSFIFVINIISGEPYVIDEDNNIINITTSKLYASAPYNKSEGWAEFELESFNYSGGIQSIWLVNTEEFDFIKPQYFNPKEDNTTHSYVCLFEDAESYFNYTSNHFWCYKNNSGDLELIFEHDYDWGNIETKTAYWNESYIKEWHDFPSNSFEVIYFEEGSLVNNFTGMNKGYILDTNINSNQLYKVRAYIKIPRTGFKLNKVIAKYWWAVKPSSWTWQDTFDNNFYIDPWIDSGGSDAGTGYLDTGLVAYWNMNESSGEIIDVYEGKYNGTNNGADYSATGIIDNAYDFELGDSDTANFSATLGGWQDISISIWVKPESWGGTTATIITNHVQANGLYFLDYYNGNFRWQITDSEGDASDYYTTTNSFTALNEWYHLVVTFDGATGNFSLYVNGTLEIAEINANIDDCGSTDEYVWLSARNDGTERFWDGLIDELGIWNVTLNRTAVLDLYNSGNAITQGSPAGGDSTPPAVTINSPTNITYTTSSIFYNTTATDETSITDGECWVTIDSGETNISLTNTTALSDYTNTSTASDGSYRALFYCNDTAGNLNDSEFIDFSVDTTPPAVYNLSTFPISPVEYVSGADYYFQTYIDGDINFVNFEFGGTNYSVTNYSMLDTKYNSSGIFYDNFTRANSGTLGSPWILIEPANTDINLTNNHSWLRDDSTFSGVPIMRYNLTDSMTNGTLKGIELSFNMQDSRGEGRLHVKVLDKEFNDIIHVRPWAESIYNLSYYENPSQDTTYTTKNLSNFTWYTLRIDNINTITNTSDIYIDGEIIATNVHFINNLSDIYYVDIFTPTTFTTSIFIDNVTYSNISDSTVNSAVVKLSDLGIGTYSYNWYVNDSMGNVNNSEGGTYIINDTVYPLISIGYPTNITYNSLQTIFNYTITEDNPDTCWITNSSGEINHTITCGENSTGIINSSEGTNTWEVYINDTTGNTNSSSVTFIVDTISPDVSNLIWSTTGGFTDNTLNFNQVIDYVNVTSTGTGKEGGCYLTVLNPSNTTIINEGSMTNVSNEFTYASDITLNNVGDWLLNVTCNDTIGNVNSTTQYLTISITSLNLTSNWYGYAPQKILNSTEVIENLDYDFMLYEFENNITDLGSNFSDMKNAINNSYQNDVKVGINYILNYNINDSTNNDDARNNISVNLEDLTASPYISTVEYISFEILNPNYYNDTQKYEVLNDLAQNATQTTDNDFVIYSKNYNSSSLDSSYIQYTTLLYSEPSDVVEFINNEAEMFRNNNSLNRIYEGVSTPLKNNLSDYYKDVLSVIRSAPNLTVIISQTNIGVLNNADVLVFNNGSTILSQTINVSNMSGVSGKDVWDSTDNYLIENNTDGNFDVNISAYDVNILFFEDLDHIQLTSSTIGSVYKGGTSTAQNFNWTNGSRAGNLGLYGAYDIMIELFDPNYIRNNFITYYGWINASALSPEDFCGYEVIILADENDGELDNLVDICINSEIYGYISVADYSNTNEWYNNKTQEADDWLALNGSLDIFIDGLDIGVSEENFSSRMRDLVDYVQVAKDKKVILNTYTAYEEFATLGKGGVMKESCVNRWNGASATTPNNYTRESWSLELNKSTWYNSHNVNVYCQAFNNRTSDGTNIIYNYTELQNIYFASKVLGYDYFYLSQPDFNYAFKEFVYDVGEDLSNSYSTDDDETYYRRYENGIVYYNSSSEQGWFDDGRVINNASVCFDLYDAHAAGADFKFTINNPKPVADDGDYTIDDADLTLYDWKTICVDVEGTTNGRYLIEGWVSPKTTIVGQGLNIGYTKNATGSKHSFYDSTPTDSFTAYTYGQNYGINVVVNESKKTSIDTTNKISQLTWNTTGKYYLNLTSDYSFPIEVWSNTYTIEILDFQNVYYKNSTGSWNNLSLLNTTTCDTNNPSFASTIIEGETHKVCYEHIGDNTTFRIVTPSLTTREYYIESDSVAPSLNFTDPTPPNNTLTNNITINMTISDENFDSFIWNWNGTNYTIYDDKLKLMLNLNNNSNLGENDTYVFDSSNYLSHGVAYNTIPTTEGVYDGGFFFDGDNDYINISDTSQLDFDTGNYTISMWVRLNSSDTGYILDSRPHNSGEYSYFIYTQSGDLVIGQSDGAGGTADIQATSINSFSTSSFHTTKDWHYIAFTRNGTSVTDYEIFFDGDLKHTNTIANVGDASDITIGDLIIGCKYDLTNCFNGTIDEVRIWNYSLTTGEIEQDYYSNFMQYNSTDWHYYNEPVNISDGEYSYYACAEDDVGNQNCTSEVEIRYVTLDTTPPQITIIRPQPTSYNYNSININFTLDEAGYCEYSLDGGVINYTLNNIDNLEFSKTVSFGVSSYNMSVYCNDSIGNNNYTENVLFTVTGTSTSGPGGEGGGIIGITSITLNEIKLDCEDWNAGVENEVVLKIYNTSNSLMNADFVSISATPKNYSIYINEGDIINEDIGIYKQNFIIQTPTTINLSATVTDNSKTIIESCIIEVNKNSFIDNLNDKYIDITNQSLVIVIFIALIAILVIILIIIIIYKIIKYLAK